MRATSLSVAATAASTVSPRSWPSESLIALKWSTSSSARASGRSWRSARESSSRRRSWKARWLARRVSGSVAACSTRTAWASVLATASPMSSAKSSSTRSASAGSDSGATEATEITPHSASADGQGRRQRAAVAHARGALARCMAIDAHGAPFGVHAMHVVAVGHRQDRAGRQCGADVVGPGAGDDRRFAAGELDDAAAVHAQEGGDALRGEHEDVSRRRAGGHRGGQLAHHGVLLGDAHQEDAPGHDHAGQRSEDEDRAERVRHDALRAGVRVVEQRQLVGGDGAGHAERREAARQEAGRVHDDEDGDLLDRRVEAARGVDRQAPC